MTGGPEPAGYKQLVERLLDLRRRDSSVDSLGSTFEALLAVLSFLSADARLSEATRPLWGLLLAVMDRRQGAKPKLFFDPPNRLGDKGAPKYTSATILRAIVNSAFLTFRKAGVARVEASEWLAMELKRAGIIDPRGRAIDARAIARWGAELGGKSLTGSDDIFATLVRDVQHMLLEKNPKLVESLDVPLSAKDAKIAAAYFIKLLKTAGF
jgi:hypothetical protein